MDIPWSGPWLALVLALAGPWPGPWLTWFRLVPVQTSSSSDWFWFRPVPVQTGSVQAIPVRFAAILKILSLDLLRVDEMTSMQNGLVHIASSIDFDTAPSRRKQGKTEENNVFNFFLIQGSSRHRTSIFFENFGASNGVSKVSGWLRIEPESLEPNRSEPELV